LSFPPLSPLSPFATIHATSIPTPSISTLPRNPPENKKLLICSPNVVPPGVVLPGRYGASIGLNTFIAAIKNTIIIAAMNTHISPPFIIFSTSPPDMLSIITVKNSTTSNTTTHGVIIVMYFTAPLTVTNITASISDVSACTNFESPKSFVLFSNTYTTMNTNNAPNIGRKYPIPVACNILSLEFSYLYIFSYLYGAA